MAQALVGKASLSPAGLGFLYLVLSIWKVLMEEKHILFLTKVKRLRLQGLRIPVLTVSLLTVTSQWRNMVFCGIVSFCVSTTD